MSLAASKFPLIRSRRLVKNYPLSGVEVHALRGIDLEIDQGEMVAIMGASGPGKSTLMNIIGCMDNQTSGDYFLDGVDVSGLSEAKLADTRNRKPGFVFQRYNLLARATTQYNVELPLFYAGMADVDARKRALEAIMLSLLGALVGIVFGVGGAKLVSLLAKMPTPISVASILISVGFSICVGVFFGFYPARKAAYLNPADALGYE